MYWQELELMSILEFYFMGYLAKGRTLYPPSERSSSL
jgi:hypothetical protein